MITRERTEAVESEVYERAGFSGAFFTLMVLSTVIASYGLLSNSTATVIGAMLVAPLMGPILGLALSLAQGSSDIFRRALGAEAAGILVCLATSVLVAILAGPDNIDYLQSEILNRTRPTLYDLGIGVAAGLAGAYATLNPRVGDSIGGVAIAVALVPPLAVTGLSLTGALAGNQTLWHYAGGSFMLFLANFLTIELAAAAMGHLTEILRARGLLRGLGIQLVLLVMTLVVLAAQLDGLLERRRLERQAGALARVELAGLPGASLETLEVHSRGGILAVDIVVRSPREIEAPIVERLQKRLTQNFGREVELGVGTILATYYASDGRLYQPRQPEPDPEHIRRQRLTESLQSSLRAFPSAELDGLRILEDGRALVTIRCPTSWIALSFKSSRSRQEESTVGAPFPA